ncbi:hypothetical protein EUX98_g7065 [Antrodiella citrinella]|uniref:Transposase family Tnp2 protein n=1 Tax=Antrodiella citrinella TaxID=2447956 RepID=A0A4S4MMR3_9APHY|nr:hypothetical protein EUX98_g7065 [Antrodiella citrinella]
MPGHTTGKVVCSCCQKLVTSRTEYNHRKRKLLNTDSLAGDEQEDLRVPTNGQRVKVPWRLPELRVVPTNHNIPGSRPPSHRTASDSCNPERDLQEGSAIDVDHMDVDAPGVEVPGAAHTEPTYIPVRYHATVEDEEEEEEEGEDDEDVGVEDAEAAASVWEELAESLIRETQLSKDDLSEEDKAYLRVFALRVNNHMSGNLFGQLPFVFPEAALASWKTIVYDCCINSCCCYVGPHVEAQQCLYCKEPRYNTSGQPRQRFVYIPIIPRLQAFFSNQRMSQTMQYRATEHVHDPDKVQDVFDSEVYRSLLGKKVTINGKTLSHSFFNDKRDVALGLSTDGFAPFRRRKKTTWPLILFNYNLPPDIRFHIQHILSLGIIPGPKKPVDFDSFLWPAVQELLRLERGVHTYDRCSDEFWMLRAYLILVFGDIPAVSLMMRMKGHNGLCPCRTCNILGVRVPNSRKTTHYVPLSRDQLPRPPDGTNPTYDPSDLPIRTQAELLAQAREVEDAPSAAAAERLAKAYGVKGVPLLSVLSSLNFPYSFPYDFMHLLWENVVKNLMLFWTGDYKKLDEGSEEYEIDSKVWEAIGKASEAAGSTIPYAFTSARPPNVATDKTSWTADSRSFWALYMEPVLLQGRFKRPKYYHHFIKLVKLLNLCLQFEITKAEVEEIRVGFIEWVKEYERFYYQDDPQRLSACPLTIHALLHVADSIVKAGPVWASWARRFPYASMNRYILNHARLQQVKLMYDMQQILSLKAPPRSSVGTNVPGYTTLALLPPHRESIPFDSIDKGTFDKIVGTLCTRFESSPAHVKVVLNSATFQEWSKVQILGGGDLIRTAAVDRRSEDSREASFVRYELLIDRNARFPNRPVILQKETFFGHLQKIYHLTLPKEPLGRVRRPSAQLPPPSVPTPITVLLAVIRAYPTTERHSTLDIHYHTSSGNLDVIDMTTLGCLVARFRVAENSTKWAVIDRSGSLARALYVEPDAAPGEIAEEED